MKRVACSAKAVASVHSQIQELNELPMVSCMLKGKQTWHLTTSFVDEGLQKSL